MASPRRKPRPADDRQASLPLPNTVARAAATKPPGKMTDEMIAEKVTAREPSPPGLPHLAEITLRLALPRPLLVALRVRAMREGKRLEGLVAELLGRS